ncbi:MAG: hypothetical protein KA885_05360 [Spirochaetes bacterium]|nr:hypothetical protein [Spirochaetota bacterium]
MNKKELLGKNDLRGDINLLDMEMDDDTREIIKKVEAEPKKENIDKAIIQITNDDTLNNENKYVILDELKNRYISLFNFNNCPDDYETLKAEAKFLSGMTQYSFLLMAQRLLKIKTKQLYIKEGYKDFKNFIENEMTISRTTVYCYMDVYSLFFDGVQLTEHDTDIEFSKLFSVIPLLKANIEDSQKKEIRGRFLSEVKDKSEKEIKEETKELKIKYGLFKQKTDSKTKLDKLFSNVFKNIPADLEDSDKLKLRSYIEKLQGLL